MSVITNKQFSEDSRAECIKVEMPDQGLVDRSSIVHIILLRLLSGQLMNVRNEHARILICSILASLNSTLVVFYFQPGVFRFVLPAIRCKRKLTEAGMLWLAELTLSCI